MALQKQGDQRFTNQTRARSDRHFATKPGCRRRALGGCPTAPALVFGPRRIREYFGQKVFREDLAALFKKLNCRYKRIRKRPAKEEIKELYDWKVEKLGKLERLAEAGTIELFYGDAARVMLEPCVPYGWQFADEDVFTPAGQSGGVNCLAFLTRENRCHFTTTEQSMSSELIVEWMEGWSLEIEKLTVVVLDNAPVHHGRRIRERRQVWERRGLYLFYLPRYSPHLNIVERLWRKLKYEWLQAKDYETAELLSYTVRQALAAVGKSLTIKFSKFALA